jgi:hypothetical protein
MKSPALSSSTHQYMSPNPAREVVVEANADPRLPRFGVAFGAYDHADRIRLHARRPVALDETDLCPNLKIHFRHGSKKPLGQRGLTRGACLTKGTPLRGARLANTKELNPSVY